MQFIKISSSQCTYYLEWVRALYWCMEPADWLMHRFTANLAARLEEALGSAESYPWFANFNASSTLSNNISLSPDPKQCQFFSQPTALWQNQIFTWPSFHSPNQIILAGSQFTNVDWLCNSSIHLHIYTLRKGKELLRKRASTEIRGSLRGPRGPKKKLKRGTFIMVTN